MYLPLGQGPPALRIFANILVFFSVLAGVVQGQSHWLVRPSNINSSLNAVAFGNGLFVAVGESGAIVTSPDGNVWTPRVSGTTDRLPAVVFGNGRFVATCANRSTPAITSADGISWTPVTVTDGNGAPADSSAFNSIAFGGGRFLAGGGADIMGSLDGISFQIIIPAPYPLGPGGPIKTLTYFRGKFYAFTGYWGFYATADGVLWNDPPGWGDIFYTESGVAVSDQISKVAILGSSNPVFSEDAGHTFQRTERPIDRYRPESGGEPLFRAACYGAAAFVAVDSKGGTWTSSRGQYWAPKGYHATAGQEFRSITFDGVNRFVAVGSRHPTGQAIIATADADVPGPPPPTYRVRSLITQAGVVLSQVRSINNAGVIAGAVANYVSAGNTVAAIVHNGHATIWSLPGFQSHANAVSDGGTTAVEILSPPRGVALLATGEAIYPFSSNRTTAAGINAQGILVGSYGFAPGPFGIYRYDTTTRLVTDLGNLGMQSIEAEAINNLSDIAGIANGVPFRLSASGEMATFPTLGGTYVYVASINAVGDVAGSSNMPFRPTSLFDTHGCLWRNGIPSDVDTLNSNGSVARGMNARGDVVGYFYPPQLDPSHAFLYTDGTMHDLNALLDGSGDGWILRSADGINDSQQIAGMGLHHGRLEPFLAEPVPGPPAGTQTRFVNVSTRLKAGAGDNVLIGGFIIQGGAKRVVVRALGPALPNLPNLMENPTLELVDGAGQRIAFNDDYSDLPYAERQEISHWDLEPPHPGTGLQRNSVLIATIEPGNYTAVVRGNNGGTGNCLVEVYNVDTDYTEGLVNISTRGPVEGGDNVMIGGFIIRGDREQRVMVRAIGPSLVASGVPDALSDTTLEIFDQDGRIAENDDWRSQQETEIIAAGLSPGDDRESAVILSLWPGSYTAIVRGKNNTSGNALVEAYQLP